MTAFRSLLPAILALAMLALAPVLASAGAGGARSEARDEARGEAGRFDYWLLSLSWSPDHCAGDDRPDPLQCAPGRRLGLVVHGLWPQWERGSWPQFCARDRRVPRSVEDAILPIMPSRGLVAHQWAKHGTCSGLDPEAYFERTRAARARLAVPEPLRAPARPLSLDVPEIERLFAAANPGLDGDGIAVVCRGRHVAEIRICLDERLGFRRCGEGVGDRCGRGEALFRPVR
jgi:ribonuclease T2